jgi:hypothetical protein
VLAHELAFRRQRITGPVLTRGDRPAQNGGELGVQRLRVEVIHVIGWHSPYRN